MNHRIRWEVRWEYFPSGDKAIQSRETRSRARRLMKMIKNHPDMAKTVKMYRVSEFLNDKGEPSMTFHRRAR